MKELKVDERFEAACPELSSDEFDRLEALIINDGVILNPILIWNDVIIDGHNRYQIAKKHGIEFTTQDLSFKSDEEAIAWIKENALGQRNLNDYQRSKLVLELEDYYKAKAKEKESQRKSTKPILAKSDLPIMNVREKLAHKAGVSHGTIDKVKYIENNADQKTKEQVETGEISINKAFNITKEPKKEPDEIDILESAASGLDRWKNKHCTHECLFEIIPKVSDLINEIRDKKINYK